MTTNEREKTNEKYLVIRRCNDAALTFQHIFRRHEIRNRRKELRVSTSVEKSESERESCDAPNTKLKWSESSGKSRIEKIAFSCFFFSLRILLVYCVSLNTHTHAHNGEELYTCMNNATEQRNKNEIFSVVVAEYLSAMPSVHTTQTDCMHRCYKHIQLCPPVYLQLSSLTAFHIVKRSSSERYRVIDFMHKMFYEKQFRLCQMSLRVRYRHYSRMLSHMPCGMCRMST